MPRSSTKRVDHFADLTDPRRTKVKHPLINLVTIALCGVICGCDDFVAIADYARQKCDWLVDLSAGR